MNADKRGGIKVTHQNHLQSLSIVIVSARVVSSEIYSIMYMFI